MDDFIAYLDTSEVQAGKLEELKAAMAELAAFVELNEPRILAYRVYFSADGSTMSVLHFHPDVASLEFHMQVAGPKFLSVKNGSKEDLNAALMSVPKVTYGGEGTTAQIASDFEAKIGGSMLSTVLPGETQTAKVGYGIPAAGFKDVRVEVMAPSFSDKPAIFKGAVK